MGSEFDVLYHNISAIEVQLEYDHQYITWNDSISLGELLNSFPGDQIVIDQFLSPDSTKISIGVVGSSDGKGLDGTGSLFRASFATNNLVGTTGINLTAYFIRIIEEDVLDTINVVDTVHGYINIAE